MTTELENKVAELEAENTRLREAIEWQVGQFATVGKFASGDELRARAFPPKFEEVEIKGYINPEGGELSFVVKHLGWVDCTVKYQRPIPVKAKRREEVIIDGGKGVVKYLNTEDTSPGILRRFFAEWYE